MSWNEFLWFGITAMACWIGAAAAVYLCCRRSVPGSLMVAGIAVLAVFIVALWIGQRRPPLRTMGETRLWYSLFIAAVGFVTYLRWRYRWLLSFSAVVACVFVTVNLLRPGIQSAELMPALRSVWFVPHVAVYILSYAMMGAATVAAVMQLYKLRSGDSDEGLYVLTDNLVYAGFGFLMLGMLMGAVWAKEAWGHYWTWDPKETWAFVTAAAYLAYIHMRIQGIYPKFTLWMLPVAFVLLMVTWVGVNYLPAAQGSIHVY